eukprot:12882390-Alexandrium_andersonii.AAC.1
MEAEPAPTQASESGQELPPRSEASARPGLLPSSSSGLGVALAAEVDSPEPVLDLPSAAQGLPPPVARSPARG